MIWKVGFICTSYIYLICISRAQLNNLQFFRRSEIQGFVPCVEENRNDALELLNCSRSIPGMTIMNMLGSFLSIGEQLDMVMEFFNAVNNIFCNRIDGNKIMSIQNGRGRCKVVIFVWS